jgi:hypothetical protein
LNGLELARAYYRDIGAPMIRDQFAEFADRIAVGLVGPGSECLGFDDELSRDHDWGPGFCMWLTGDDFKRIGGEIQWVYTHLPGTFMGYGPRVVSPGEEWRVGTLRTSEFYARFTGLDRPPATIAEWLLAPEHALASCTSGAVFHDPLGEFSRWRGALLAYYPEDIRRFKVATLCITAAQAGQYNYQRSVARAEVFSATNSLVRFCADAMLLVFLLNRHFAPFHKWLHRAVRELPLLGREVGAMVATLLDERAGAARPGTIENVATLISAEMRRQGLSDSRSDFLLDHASSVRAQISDPELRGRLMDAP